MYSDSEPHRVTVGEVVVRHDCGGRRSVFIHQNSDHDFLQQTWKMSPVIMTAEQKLQLATVSVGDVVQVKPQSYTDPSDLMIMGDFTHLISPFKPWSVFHCECGEVLNSDGVIVWCPDPYCPLTVQARLERLANTVFYSPVYSGLPYLQNTQYGSLPFSHYDHYQNDNQGQKPFLPLINPRTWSPMDPTLKMSTILLDKRLRPLHLSHFLVPQLFETFCEMVFPAFSIYASQYSGINRFFSYMDTIQKHRDHYDQEQNNLIQSFLWSLGLQSLHPSRIQQMVVGEATTPVRDDPLLYYAYLLTHPFEMCSEFGMWELEAQHLAREVYSRRHELSDIFRGYMNAESLKDSFDLLMKG